MIMTGLAPTEKSSDNGWLMDKISFNDLDLVNEESYEIPVDGKQKFIREDIGKLSVTTHLVAAMVGKGYFELTGEASEEIARKIRGNRFTVEMGEHRWTNCVLTTRRGNTWYFKGEPDYGSSHGS